MAHAVTYIQTLKETAGNVRFELLEDGAAPLRSSCP